jgi:hypothetical protein
MLSEVQHRQRDLARMFDVAGEVDRGRTAGAYLPLDLVAVAEGAVSEDRSVLEGWGCETR